MAILGISGKLSSGKDSVAIIMQGLDLSLDRDQIIHAVRDQQYFTESSWQVKRFADKIKDTICLWLGCSREQLEDRQFKEKPLGEEWDKYGVSWNCPSDQVETHFSTYAKAEEYAINEGAHPSQIDSLNVVRKVQMTPRKLLQLLGTECGRQILHPSIWVNALFADYDAHPKSVKQKWIIPDTRFPNEIDRVDKYNGLKIRVERDFRKRMPKLFMKYGYDGSDDSNIKQMFYNYLKRDHPDQYEKVTHPSETALDNYDDWDYVIENNGTISELVEKVKTIMKKENYV